jgi:hypothetical protein
MRDRIAPLPRIGLLRADVKRYPDRAQPKVLGGDEQVGRHVRLASELAGQRPIRSLGFDQHPAEDACTRCGACQLLELRRTVEGKQLDASGPSGGYVALALDRVAERQPLRRNVQAATDLQFSRAREIETGAKSSQCRDHLGLGIGLYRVVDLRRGEKLLQ